ncbi:MAG TPA: hypothetical protein VMD99_12145 [Terriglobales bacterium]|nr:hypothetical protein [Terriglobales bacterium]
MGALTIAFDTTIVGALALPWVILVVHLFFFEGENRFGDLLAWVQKQQMTAAAGVLLFAVAFTLGSAVSRIAQDFFNDDDLYAHVPITHHWLRMGTTEDRIITSVYCDREDNDLLRAGIGNPALKEKIASFQCRKTESCGLTGGNAVAAETENSATKRKNPSPEKPNNLCPQTLSWLAPPGLWEHDKELNETAADVFGLEESAMLLKGEDATQRLRQLHDQIMVLRGAAFNGLIGFSLCVFAWGARIRCEKPRSGQRWLFAVIPAVFLFVTALAAKHHFHERAPSAPPYMEFSLFLIGLAGVLLLWIPRMQPFGVHSDKNALLWRWPSLTLLSAVLMVTAVLGWWATEVAYTQEVIYHYDSQSTGTPPPAVTAP